MTTQSDEKAAPAAAADEPARYCAYDLTYLKFIGSVLDSKAKVNAQDVVKDAKKSGSDIEVREV